MKEVINKNECCGCHACLNICPKNAITMREDSLGFKYPKIDEEKCIKCEICKKICPVLNNSKEKKKEIISYACYNKNLDERITSSSGGIFILIAKEIIKRKGVVFGATFDPKFNVIHSYAENIQDLKKFMGSKYTQSTVGNTYKKAKEFLENNRYVLFSGTPCQIEGLKSYLKKDYEKLYTQDIICHGVPSPKVWRKYIDYQKSKYGEKIKDISFRDKSNSWSLYRMKITFEKKVYSKNFFEDLYLRSFLKNNCLRDSCYNCSFKKLYRESDLTFADYWGISNEHKNMDDDKGTSLLIINSDKGKELFESIKPNLIYVKTNLENALKYNESIIKSAQKPIYRDNFIEQIDKLSIDKLINKYSPKPNIIRRLIIYLKKIIKSIVK